MGCRARGVVRPSFTPRVRRALKLEHQPLGGAVKVNDEPMQHVLAPRLEAEDAPLPQQRPCISLSGRCRASQLARLRKLPAGRDTPEWIHKSHARAASSDHQTETPRRRACCCGLRMCSREVAQGSPSPEGRGGKGGEDSRTGEVRGEDSRSDRGGRCTLPSTPPGTYCTATRDGRCTVSRSVTSRTRREWLQMMAAMGAGALVDGLFPRGLARAATGRVAQQQQDRVAQFRAQIGAIPIQSQPLAKNVTLLAGPGGNVVVLQGSDGLVVVDTRSEERRV